MTAIKINDNMILVWVGSSAKKNNKIVIVIVALTKCGTPIPLAVVENFNVNIIIITRTSCIYLILI